ncbi:MAG: hypothetical protein KME07_11275 [Pegethrix bostrychoides GSE-TBD4-15B]|uniref:Uncharacterized protein n=1 Tax=Pegethrix bostrychoides GSE-TBD4-15B TaxID=2839662 RepID=A0A951U4U3_9CYAN|nr:hypothetical protein [Pegethrix bostrychoides GSE-TBD4-15B]
MKRGVWEVWFYAPGGRKLVDRFHRRNEAESHKAKLGRLIGKPTLLTVCFDPNSVLTPNEVEPPNC